MHSAIVKVQKKKEKKIKTVKVDEPKNKKTKMKMKMLAAHISMGTLLDPEATVTLIFIWK